MSVFLPSFLTTTVRFLLLIPFLVLPVALIVLVVLFVRKLNSIDKTLHEILENQKNNRKF